MTRESELPEIEQFLAAKGATRCPTVYVHPTSTNFSAAEEAHRLGRVKVTTARGRYSHSAARTPGATLEDWAGPIRLTVPLELLPVWWREGRRRSLLIIPSRARG